MDNWALHRLLIDHEGRRTHPYRDSVGKITIGVGRNLTDRGLSGGEIDLLLANDIALARTIVTQLFGQDISAISTRRHHALLSMAFNLGGPRLSKFIKMRGLLRLVIGIVPHCTPLIAAGRHKQAAAPITSRQ